VGAQFVGFAEARGDSYPANPFQAGARAIDFSAPQAATPQFPSQQSGLVGFQDSRTLGAISGAPAFSNRGFDVPASTPQTGVVGFVDARSSRPSIAANKNRELSFNAPGTMSSGAVGFVDSRRASMPTSQATLTRGLDFGLETSAPAPRQQEEALFTRAKNLTPGQRRILEGRAGLR
jgi:hypothetical protein